MRTGEIGRERGRRGDRESKMRISSIYPHRLHTALKAGTYRWHWATYGCLLKPLISLSLCTAPSVTCLRHPWVCASFTILSDSSTHAYTHTQKNVRIFSECSSSLRYHPQIRSPVQLCCCFCHLAYRCLKPRFLPFVVYNSYRTRWQQILRFTVNQRQVSTLKIRSSPHLAVFVFCCSQPGFKMDSTRGHIISVTDLAYLFNFFGPCEAKDNTW